MFVQFATEAFPIRLDNHLYTHTNKKLFVFELYNTCCSQNMNLKNQLRTHTG